MNNKKQGKRTHQVKNGLLILGMVLMLLLIMPAQAQASEKTDGEDVESTEAVENTAHAYEFNILEMQKVLDDMTMRELKKTVPLLELKGIQSEEDEVMLAMARAALTTAEDNAEVTSRFFNVFLIVIVLGAIGYVAIEHYRE